MRTIKIRRAFFNNRKKQFYIEYVSGKKFSIHYSQVGILQNIISMWVDKETNNMSLGIKLEDGTEEYMPYDQPLALCKDPEYILQTDIEKLIAYIKKAIHKQKISKKFIAEKLHTSLNQIQRLLNPGILNKNLEQLYHVAILVGLELELTIKKAA